jgi:hypothetical protein
MLKTSATALTQATGANLWPRLPTIIIDSTIFRTKPRRRARRSCLALKAHEVKVKALKDEFKSRGLLTAAGEHFTVTRSDQVSSRLDVAAVKAFLGDAWRKFEATSITTVIRIKAVQQLAAAA